MAVDVSYFKRKVSRDIVSIANKNPFNLENMALILPSFPFDRGEKSIVPYT